LRLRGAGQAQCEEEEANKTKHHVAVIELLRNGKQETERGAGIDNKVHDRNARALAFLQLGKLPGQKLRQRQCRSRTQETASIHDLPSPDFLVSLPG